MVYDHQNGSYSSAVGYDTERISIAHFGTKFSEKNTAFICRVVEGSPKFRHLPTSLHDVINQKIRLKFSLL
jgi:hypothetical protein